ncbi:DUF5667 domain-containing protein [Paenibacillus aceris]|uniref:DUF5667 domain-containing protein n=1 Tax=Paenibacillus aceris TaxID=869555 RepID=A0ABS4I7H0_9BACL|nr:DUF5667 domain-containing protein [Paenibacillus aceris]MBP1966872.1 hypothetical protein [Paenibacillus aceris]NHW38944.1 hypothetical protein [Paenibacillus aceris]
MLLKLTKETKRNNLLAKSAILSILIFSVGTGSVLASEITTTTLPSSTPTSVSVTQNTSVSQAGTTLNESETETPDLLPGDFFYFVKTMYENIRMALTVNDVKEARLLTALAQERLKEANALLAQGKSNEASLSLQKSLETQQSAVQKTDQATGISITVKTTLAENTTQAPATEAEASTQKETATTIAAIPSSEQTADPEQTETEDVNTPVKEVKNPEQVLKVKTDLQHNILALASALEKVGNPKAQLALMKNIEKSFTHLDKKLAKIERKEKLGQENESVTAKEEQSIAPLVPSPTPVPAPVTNESVSDQKKQEHFVTEKTDQTKKGEDKQDLDKFGIEKEKKNHSHHNGGEKGNGNGNGHEKNKGSKQD